MIAAQTLLSLHAGVTCFMTGLIWFVQVVHYPLMARVTGEAWSAYHAGHQRLTTLVVGVAMPLELVLTGLVVALGAGWLGQPVGAPVWSWLGGALLAVIWGSTFLVQVPLHERLSRSHDPAIIRRLVATNWVRTTAWTARALIALALVLGA